MIDTINLMIPTYKRDDRLFECMDSFVKNASGNIIFSILINDGEFTTRDRIQLYSSLHAVQIDVYQTGDGPPHLGRFYNELYRYSSHERNIAVSMIGDDMVCMTPEWDRYIKHSLNEMDGLGIVHCRDGIQNGNIAVNLFTTRDWVDEAHNGRFMDERFAADYIDVLHTEAARAQGKERYLDDVLIEHRHWSKSGEMDETALRLRKVWKPAEDVL